MNLAFKGKNSLLILLLCILISTSQIHANIPFNYEFPDDDNDGYFYKFVDGEGYSTNADHNFDAIELVGVGYKLERQAQLMTMSMRFLDTPVVNTSFYYSLEIELENLESKLSIRVRYSTLGSFFGGSENNLTSLDIFYEQPDSLTDQSGEIVTRIEGNTVLWVFQPDEVDIIRVYDDPTMLLARIRGEVEYYVNGSSTQGTGDYYRDEFRQTEFPFLGGVQGDGGNEGFFDIVDPIAVAIYFGIPLLIVLIRVGRKIKDFQTTDTF